MVNVAALYTHTFLLGSHNSQVLPLVTRGLLPHVLKSIHKICLHSNYLYGVLKNSEDRERGWDYSNFTKGEIFLVSLKLSAIWGNLTLHHSCLPLPKNTTFLQFGQVENIRAHLFGKVFLVWFSLLSPQVQQKEDDEPFANNLQIYVSRTFTKAKKSVICPEYPISSKFHLSNWKSYFSEFIDKYLNIEEVKYLIHCVKFKMWPALFYVNSPCFLNIFDFWCQAIHYIPQFALRLTTGILIVALGWTLQFFP